MQHRLLAVPLAAALAIAGSSGPALAAALPGCDDLTISQVTRAPSGTATLLATVPASVGRQRLPAGAFRLEQDGQRLPARVDLLDPSDLAVVIGLVASPTAPFTSFEDARAAALELLVELPPEARAEVVGAYGLAPSAPTTDRTATATALARLSFPGTSQAAIADALRTLPAGSRNHEVLFTSDPTGVAPTAPGVTVHRLQYAGQTQLTSSDGCPAPTSPATPLLPAVDSVVSRMTGQYAVRVDGLRPGPAQLLVEAGAVRAVARFSAGTRAADRASTPPSKGKRGLLRLFPLLVLAELGLLALLFVVAARRNGGPDTAARTQATAGIRRPGRAPAGRPAPMAQSQASPGPEEPPPPRGSSTP